VDVNEHLNQTISEQQEKIKSLQDTNSHLNTVIITNEKRMESKNYKEHYIFMSYFDEPSGLKLIRRSKDIWARGL
jgi:hypothetical protein